MKIFLIRHGETTGDIENHFGGDFDDHLTKKGKQQVKQLVKKLIGKNIRMIYNSPKIRTKETATILSTYLDVPNVPIDDLRERNSYGVLTSMKKSDAKKKFPKEFSILEQDPIYHDNLPNCEKYNDFKQRVISVFQKIVKRNPNPSIAIVTHGGIIKCFNREVSKNPEFSQHGDCSYLELDYNQGKYKLNSLHNAESEK